VTRGHGSAEPSSSFDKGEHGLRTRSALAGYGLAVALALGAIVLARATVPLTDEPLYVIPVAAVGITVWYGGFGPGLLAVACTWALAPFVLETEASPVDRDAAYRWSIGLACALAIVWVSLVMRRGQQRAATAAVAAEESTRQMEMLQELATALSAAVTPSDVARQLVDLTPALLGARGGALGLIEGDELVIVDPAGVARQTHRPGLRLPLDALAPITRAAAEGTLHQAEDRAAFEARYPDGAALTAYAQAALAVPLRSGGEVVGSMSFLFDVPGAAHEEAETIALIAADLGGQALERAGLYDRERQSRQALDRILRVAPRLYFGTPEEVSIAICREARRTLDADITEIWRVDADWLWLELVCRDPDDEELSAHDRLEIVKLPGLREAVESLEVTFVADTEQSVDEDLLAYVRRLGIRSWLWAPIVVGGRVERLLFFSWHSVVLEPDASTVVLARRFSDQAGLALEQLDRREAQEQAAKRALETRRLLDATAALASAATPAEVTAAILREGLRSLGAVAGVVVGRSAESGELEILDTEGYKTATLEPWQRIPLDAAVPLAEAVRDDRLITIESVEELESRFPALVATRVEETSSWLVVPLSAGGSVIGAAGFSFADPREFSESDLEFTEALAQQSGQALERALLLAAEYAARTRAEDMVVLASALSQAASPTEILQAAGGQVLSLAHADAVGIYLQQDGATLELIGTVGDTAGVDLQELDRLPLDGATPPAHAARSREAVWIEGEEESWARFSDTEKWRRAGVRSAGAVPLMVDRRLLGIMFVAFRTQTGIEPEARRVMESVARQAAQPLERAWLMDREQAARIAAETASRRTRQLQLVAQALAAASTPREVATIVVRETLTAVSGDAAALYALDREREAPELLAVAGMAGGEVALKLAEPVTDTAMTGAPLVVDAESAGGKQESTIRAALAAAGHRSAVYVPLSVGTRILGSLLVCFRSRDRLPDEDVALLQTLARIAAQALERSRLFDEEQRLRVRSERIQRLTASLSGSLTQRDVAEVVVDALVQAAGADAAALSVVVEERQLQKKLFYRGYADELQESWLEVPLDTPTPGNRALANRSLVFYETLGSLAPEFPEAATDMRRTDHESFLFVPLIVGGKANGLVVTSWADRVTLSDEDRVFIETLASQAAQALDRARHFESERTIAETLQRSVLPASLPRVAGIQLSARYLPGTEEVDVGGDWFDAIQLGNGRLGLAVGDVVGKGVQSAATMAQLRNALRAFALDQMKPSSTVARLNRLTDELSDSAFATAVYAVLDPKTRVCRFTSAGHPPPLVVYPNGVAVFLEGGRGLPLGTGAATTYAQRTVELPIGSTLVLYTDGLVERRGEAIDVGLERLRTAAEEGPSDPERLVEHVLSRLVGVNERGDDIALLAVRLLAVAPTPLELDLPNDVRSLDLVRDALRVWLQPAPVTQSEAHEIVLAAWEACANAIEHPEQPRAGSFQLAAELVNSTVRVSVRDSGRWLPETERSDRGLGLRLIRCAMSSVEIEATEEGTLVRLEKALAGEDVPVS
jgi:GAF domain-containing protein/anti-sigma regulatory factor (Ser/Thr protein kinase)